MKLLLATAIAILVCVSGSPARAGWAIAYSPSTGYVTAYGGGSASADARKTALGDCGKRAADCEIIASGWNGCFAFAKRGKSGNGWAVGEGANVDLARADALKQCKSRASGNCEVEINYCDGSGGFRPKYESCQQFKVWQEAVAQHGKRSEQAGALCIKLNRDLASRGQPACICN